MGWYLSWPSSLRAAVTFLPCTGGKGKKLQKWPQCAREGVQSRCGPTSCARVGLSQSREGGVTCGHLEAGFAAHSLAPPLCQALCLLTRWAGAADALSSEWCPGLRAAWEEEGLGIGEAWKVLSSNRWQDQASA